MKLFVLVFSLFVAISAAAQTITHNVRPGDTFESIAAKYDIAVNELMQANPYMPQCHVGARLVIPTVQKSDAAQPSKSQVVTSQQPQKNIEQPADKPMVQVAVTEQPAPDPYMMIYDGLKLLKDNKYSKAKRLFTKALKIKEIPEAYYYRGLCNYKKYKWKAAYRDFGIAKRSAELDEKMKADASELYAFTYSKHQEKVERRRERWAEFGAAVGTTLLAVGTIAVGAVSETMAASSGYGYGYGYDYGYGSAAAFYSPSVGSYSSSGITSMSTTQFNNYLNTQLTDLLYLSAAQVEQQNYNEYMQSTNGGQMMDYDQWMNIKAQTMMSTQDVGSYNIESSQPSLSDRKRDILNTTAGEACLTCKGTGKCPTCNGTKVTHSFYNTYKCTVCNDNGDCPTCNGAKVTSWNR